MKTTTRKVKKSVRHFEPTRSLLTDLDPQREEAVYHLQAHILAMQDALDTLKGTRYYSAVLDKELQRFISIKIDAIFARREEDLRFYGEATTIMYTAFTDYTNRLYLLGQQPEAVQRRFSDGLNNLFIQCGVYLPEKDTLGI